MTRESFQSPTWESTAPALQELLDLPTIASMHYKAEKIIMQRITTYLEYDNDPAHASGSIGSCEFFANWRDEIMSQIGPMRSSQCNVMLMDMTLSIIGRKIDADCNNKEYSDYYSDDNSLLKASVMIGNIHFSCINTAGHLREISGLLRNCADHRVHLGIDGKAEFWLYRNDKTRESALLQLGAKNFGAKGITEMHVVEFNGYDNAGVSSAAKQHLADWLNAQTQKCHDFSGVQICRN